MKRTVPLHEIAHARAGDKGNRSNVSLFAFDAADYPVIKAQITAERLKAAFPELLKGHVERFELDHLHGMNFVMDQALEGGVNLSLNLDAHGKSWSFLILGLTVEIDRD
ncbi:MAG: AtuA-related protein [Geminicoccaceae bacterium]